MSYRYVDANDIIGKTCSVELQNYINEMPCIYADIKPENQHIGSENGLDKCDKCDYFISVEDAYKSGKADLQAENEKCEVPIIHGKAELEIHDAKVRADAIEPIMKGYTELVELKNLLTRYFCEVDLNTDKTDLEKLALKISSDGMQTIGWLVGELGQIKEQK